MDNGAAACTSQTLTASQYRGASSTSIASAIIVNRSLDGSAQVDTAIVKNDIACFLLTASSGWLCKSSITKETRFAFEVFDA